MKHPERSPYARFGPEGARYGDDAAGRTALPVRLVEAIFEVAITYLSRRGTLPKKIEAAVRKEPEVVRLRIPMISPGCTDLISPRIPR